MTEEEIKQRNESKEFLKDLQYYLFQNKRSPKIDKLSVLLDNDEKRIADLEKENAELKEKLEMEIALKDEEMGCIETDFNTFKSKAKEYIKLLLMNCVGVYESTGKTITEIQAEAKEFLKEE